MTTDDVYMCPPDHKHAEKTTCYAAHGCRCDPCKVMMSAYSRGRRASTAGDQTRGAQAEGQLPGEAAPRDLLPQVQQHVRQLHAAKMSATAIARAAGVELGIILSLLEGEDADVALSPRSIALLMKVTTGHAPVPLDHLIPALGSQRRIQALAAQGWSLSRIEGDLGRAPIPVTVVDVLQATHVTVRTYLTVKEVYLRRWESTPPAMTDAQRADILEARDLAQNAGWLPALAWEDIDRDKTPARPSRGARPLNLVAVGHACGGAKVKLTVAERRIAVGRMIAQNHSDEEIADRLGNHVKTIARIRRELAFQAAAENAGQPEGALAG